MDKHIRFITHKDKAILLVDCTNCSSQELETIARVLPTYVTAQPKESVLLLADFTGATFDKKLIEIVKPALVFDRPHVKRSAWVGTEGLPKVLYEHLKSFSQRDLPLFATRAEALEWLVSE
ncbi:MAG: hypothetical protein DMG90_16070 [Acidobacteria bacterium]|jgi:hypothetical protein|nr:MAG: hypothetical protein DMG91_02395 [Acidobacteriota bacterium]PYV88013.1 MAG: hypothetical protein DMG90_16070 [Acidobacteriota bacterium]